MIAVLEAAGHTVRFVGGCVRDAILGITPHDLDLATDAKPDDVLRLLKAADGIKAIPTGIDHGTITAIVDDARFEITTLRQDVATDGRHAVVSFGTDWQADAERRDFTINALFMSADGAIEDYTDGLSDLAARRVRFIGDAATRIREDHLRMLRFFRFHARFADGAPDAEALAACEAHRDLVAALSGERLQDEMLRLMVTDRAASALEQMQAIGLLTRILTVPANTERFADVEKHPAYHRQDAVLGLRLLLPDDAAQIDQVADRLKLSNQDRRRLQLTAKAPDWAFTTPNIRLFGYREGKQAAVDTLWLAYEKLSADALADHLVVLNDWEMPRLPVDGHAVMAAGVEPGPGIKQALAALEEWWFAHDCTPDQDALLAYLQEWLSDA